MIKQFEGHVMSDKELFQNWNNSQNNKTHIKSTDYNYYLDESCHLMNSDSQYMVIGALACPKNKTKTISKDIKNIKEKHSISPMFEIKSTKVSMGKLDFYQKLLTYFINENNLRFRAIIVDKNLLNHKKFKQTHDDFYYKISYCLFRYFMLGENNYIYIDHKDTYSNNNGQHLQEILNNGLRKYDKTYMVQQIDSKESNLLQLSDLLIGLVTYDCRKLQTNSAKLKLIEYLVQETGQLISETTPLVDENKIDILRWRPDKR